MHLITFVILSCSIKVFLCKRSEPFGNGASKCFLYCIVLYCIVCMYVCMSGYAFRHALRYRPETWLGDRGRAHEV